MIVAAGIVKERPLRGVDYQGQLRVLKMALHRLFLWDGVGSCGSAMIGHHAAGKALRPPASGGVILACEIEQHKLFPKLKLGCRFGHSKIGLKKGARALGERVFLTLGGSRLIKYIYLNLAGDITTRGDHLCM